MSEPGTIGWLRDHNHALIAQCACGHHRKIDLDALVDALGADRSYLNSSLAFRCTDCGAITRHISIQGRTWYPL